MAGVSDTEDYYNWC